MLRILVVEDDDFQQLAAKQLLKEFGHTLIMSDHFHQTRELLEKEQFDVVLTDLNIPLRRRCENERDEKSGELQPKPYGAVIAMHAAMRGVKKVGILTLRTFGHDWGVSVMAAGADLRIGDARILGRAEEYRGEDTVKRWDLLLQELLKD